MTVPADLRPTFASIASKLEELKTSGSSGIQFAGGGFSNLLFLMLHYSKLPDEIPEISRYQICREAAFSVGKEGTITADALHGELGRRCSQYLQQPRREFVVVSGLSVQVPANLCSNDVDGWQISVQPNLPKKYGRSFLQHTHVRSWTSYGRDSSWVVANGVARTAEEALDDAMDSMDLLRGLWNLGHGAGTGWSLEIGGSHRPVNEILFGPVHTVHLPTGEPAGSWGYDPSYCLDTDRWYRTSPEGWQSAAELLGDIDPRTVTGPMRAFVAKAIIRYCRALDSPDPEGAFVAAWGVLEYLTGSNATRASSRLLERARNTYSESTDLDAITLEMLLDQRNASVHRGVSSLMRRTGIALLLNLVTDLMVTLLRVQHQFRSPEAFWKFLDLPAKHETLDEEITLRTLAKSLRGYV